jgi:RimJ/RimL family protein N-acetyltransferase
MVLNQIPDWQWFWGVEKQPSVEESKKILQDFDVVESTQETMLAIQYDHKNLVAYPHIYVAPDARNSGKGLELILRAEEIARADGMRKIVAQIVADNPYFLVGEKSRLGYTLEGELKNQVLIGEQPRSLFLYGKLLQQNQPFNKKE